MRALIATLAGLLFLIHSSCSTMRAMPETDYEAADPAGNKMHKLTTTDGRVYEFKKFAVTDSALVILEVTSFGRSSWSDDMSRIKTPVVIPWVEIQSLERAERSNLKTAIAITAGVVVVGGIVYTALAIRAISLGLGSL